MKSPGWSIITAMQADWRPGKILWGDALIMGCPYIRDEKLIWQPPHCNSLWRLSIWQPSITPLLIKQLLWLSFSFNISKWGCNITITERNILVKLFANLPSFSSLKMGFFTIVWLHPHNYVWAAQWIFHDPIWTKTHKRAISCLPQYLAKYWNYSWSSVSEIKLN